MKFGLEFILILGAIISGFFVISSKNPVHSVLNLVLVFVNVSILLIILGIEFLSILFIIVYVGAIAILFLFVIMMLNIKLLELIDNKTRYLPIGFLIGLLFFNNLLESSNLSFNYNSTIVNSTYPSLNSYLDTLNIELLGNILYTDYFFYFIIASLILLVAMIGAIILTIFNTTHNSYILRQDLFSQINTNYNKTILIS
jgi:NADH-quinone oxidoreductase subunit J